MSERESLVLREDRGPIVILTLNRPERRNALSRALVVALGDALDQIATDPGPRAVILTGKGPTFCAGMDLKEAEAPRLADESERAAIDDMLALGQLVDQVHQFPRPTIAALNGDALAGGAGLALACDFVVISAGARIGYPEVRRGLVAAIVLPDLIRQVGDRRARALLLTGAPIDADEAERWGLAHRVVEGTVCLDAALTLAQSLLESAPGAIAITKRLLDEASRRPTDPRGAAAVSASIRISDEATEGMRAFLEKRPPRWAERG